jgi:uncharacterized membrane protein
MVIDEELEKKGSLTLGISMILSVIVMHAIVLPSLLKFEDEYAVTIPFLFLVGLIGYAVLTLVFYGIMTLAVKLLARLLSKDHI